MSKNQNRKAVKRFFRSRYPVILALLIQIVVLAYIIISGSRISQAFSYFLSAVSVLSVLVILSGRGEGSYKLTWIFWILSFPLLGGFFYLVLQAQWSKKSFSARAKKAEESIKPLLPYPEECVLKKQALDDAHIPALRYLGDSVGYPSYCARSRFLSSGEEMLNALLLALERAEKYIFLEYFIIEEGEMWDAILSILKRKAREGVLIRVLYDDVGCFTHLPKRYFKTLREYGIEAVAFHPFVSLFSIEQNNRDHRKIAVVDGTLAITGGINLADEYINRIERFGHWNDAAVMVEGGAAWSFTLMFLQMWELASKRKEDLSKYRPTNTAAESSFGIVTPYADSPMDNENVGENVYLSLVRSARKYVYITTPYLIISETMQNALTLAAKSGVDVKIITPAKWDKRVVHVVTRSYYQDLIAAGVRIYEYTPGFIHAKTLVSDDCVATVGSVNFDYRSLYLHFECGAVLSHSPTVLAVKENFEGILSQSEKMTASFHSDKNLFFRIWQALLRLLAPLL